MSPFQANRWLPVWVLALMDAFSIVGGGLAAAWIRFLPEYLGQELAVLVSHPGFIAYAVGAQWALATTFDLYRPQVWRGRDELLVRMAAQAMTLPVTLTLGVYLVPGWQFGRGLLLLTLTTALTFQAIGRLGWLAWGANPPERQAVLVGDGPIVTSLLTELRHRPWAPFKISRHIPASGLEEDPEEVQASLSRADLLIVATLSDGNATERVTALNFRGTPVIDAAGAFAELTGRVPVQQVDSRWFIATGDFSNVATTPFHHLQRAMDIVGAMLLLVISSPIILLSALVVGLTGGLPVIYRQTRLGRFRTPFTLFKLRTMDTTAEQNGPEFAEREDQRILPFAAFLRRWRIDELPQLLNVLKGDMSLVGPRPERPEITEELEGEIPFFGYRFSVRPGLTGWAQVNHPYCADLDDHRIKLEYDLYSLRQHGPMLYLLVLVRTAGALVFSPGR
ncbi:MAG: sugar transferase [Thermoanaerobaculales bacterium]|nr:sugar transferase [Thermoanaerobaculales bacterium]